VKRIGIVPRGLDAQEQFAVGDLCVYRPQPGIWPQTI
jgi:hypothetical protein